MVIYKDIFNNDPLFSDEYRRYEIDDVIYEVECGHTRVEKWNEDIKEVEVNEVITIIHNFNLNRIENMRKRDFMDHLRRYIRRVAAHLENTNPGCSKVYLEKINKYILNNVIDKFNGNFFVYLGQS